MTTAGQDRIAGVELGEMRPDELPEAAALLALAYRDNPLTFALLGEDPDRRLRVNEGIHAYRIGAMDLPPIVARRGSELVGVCGFDPPGGTDAPPEAQQRLFQMLVRAGPDVPPRAQAMLADFARNADPGHRWHLGPVGVSPDAQGLGIGTMMVEAFCTRVDAMGEAASLETDQEKNARWYERSGFAMRHVGSVLDIPVWFMQRQVRK